MTKNFIRRYFVQIGVILICVLFTGLMIVFYTYLSLKNNMCQNVERNSQLILSDLEDEYDSNLNNSFNSEMLEIYNNNLYMDIYIYDISGNILASNSFNDEFYEHINWDFSSSVQCEINPVTNISYMEKFTVSFEPNEVYVACVMPYSKISAHTDQALKALLIAIIVIIIAFSVVYWIYIYVKYKYLFQIEKNAEKGVGEDNVIIPIPEHVIPEYEPLVLAVKTLQERMDYSDRHMVEFISNISHELKTPLTVIKGFLGAIIDGTIDAEHRYTYLVKVLNESNRMQQIIKNMLNTSNIEAGKITLKMGQFNILDVISEIIFMFERQIENKHINIMSIAYPEIMVSGDRILLHQVFYNLMENAIKFVDKGGNITISVGYYDRNIYFHINNTGNGIPQKDLVHVFDRFFKSDYSRSNNPDGVGLGLSIVRKFVNQHNGNITISSEEGKFTEFVLTFPQNFAVK